MSDAKVAHRLQQPPQRRGELWEAVCTCGAHFGHEVKDVTWELLADHALHAKGGLADALRALHG